MGFLLFILVFIGAILFLGFLLFILVFIGTILFWTKKKGIPIKNKGVVSVKKHIDDNSKGRYERLMKQKH